MKRFTGYLIALIVAIAAASVANADSSTGSMGMMKPSIYTPATIKWVRGTGEFKGLTVAMLDGDPTKMGTWTVRIKVPAGTKFPVHFHSDTERVTVISGTFLAALGSKYDAAKLMALPAGSFAVIPAGVRHYAAANVNAVIQLSGTAPFSMKMDKASDM